MKKLIVLYFLLLSFLSFSQTKGTVSSIYLGCYTDRDTLTKEAIKSYSNFKLNELGTNSLGLKSWEIILIQKEHFGKKHKSIASGTNTDMITPEMKEAILSNFSDIHEILIQNIVISFVDKYTSELIDQEYPPIIFYLNDNAFKKCDQPVKTNTNIQYNGKLLTGKNKDIPLSDQKITLQTISNKELQSTITNNHGNFTFTNLNSNDSYKITVPIEAQSKIKDGQLYMAKQDGTVIKNFNKTNQGFVYELLPNDVNIMTKIKEEDIESEIKKFNISKPTSVDKTDNVEYLGKLLTGRDKKIQLYNQKIVLQTLTGLELQSTTTNKYGNFTITDLNIKNSYKIIVFFDTESKIKDGELYMAKLDGTVIKSFDKTPNGFEYELSPEEIK